MKIEKIKLSRLKSNKGQVLGLPQNPRLIRDYKYEKLKKSLIDDPEMLELREIIAYDNNGELVVICGNMRLKAMQELGIKETIVKILPNDTAVQKLQSYTIKDNVGFGEHNWDIIANEWDTELLADWGLDVPSFEVDVDYSILDDQDTDQQLQDMTDGVKKAIQIEFESEHYDEAYQLVKFWREKGAYVGKMILDYLKIEKNKL
jgi:ParB-like chromosome segregation protein Spo0J